MAYNYRSPLENAYDESPNYVTYPVKNRPWDPPQRPIPGHSDSFHHGNIRRPIPQFNRHENIGPYSLALRDRSHRSDTEHSGSSSHQNHPRYSDRYKPTAYPKELKQLFGAMECRLCGVEVSSPIVSKMHYSGKQHMKKVKSFLVEWSERTGNPLPDVAGDMHTEASVSTLSDYCDICDVTLTSVNDKLLHYSGKNHKKNEKDPANAKKKKKAYDTIDFTDRFGIGADFSTKIPEAAEIKLETTKVFSCDICDVKAVSQDQLNAHLIGKKHKEKLEKLESDEPDKKKKRPFHCEICNVSLETRALWNLHCDGKRHAKNITKLEMAQGEDFCDICDVRFTSVDQYHMHMQGKKHDKKVKQQLCLTTIPKPDEKVSIACQFCPYVGGLKKHECDYSLANISDDLQDGKPSCAPCRMVFESEKQLNEHKLSRRHIICVLNQTTGDKIVDELQHWYCFICKKQCRSHKQYTEHLFEERHMSLTSNQSDWDSKTNLFQCTVCDVVIDSQAKEEHMQDPIHLKKSLRKDTLNTLAALAHQDIATTSYHCANCDVVLPSFVKYSEHLLGDEHVDRMVARKLSMRRI